MKFRKVLIAFAIVNIGLNSVVGAGSTVFSAEDGTSSGMSADDTQREERRPKVNNTSPYNKETYVNPRYLRNSFEIEKADENGVMVKESQAGHYISVTFKSNYEDLSSSITSGSSTVGSAFSLVLNGESINLVDDERDFVKEIVDTKQITIHIPVKDEWSEGGTYTASVPGGLVSISSIIGTTPGALPEQIKSNAHTWEFTIDSTPTINKVIDGSVPEEFDEKEYITIEGNNFSRGTYVTFESTTDGKTYSAYMEKYDSDEKQILKVYLPRGRNSLPVGTYNIMINNGWDFESKHEYGVFSVVPKGKYLPDEGYNKTDRDRDGKYINIGEVKKYTNTSADTLLLDSKYSNSFRLDLDLDKLMGEDVWTRNIEYKANTYGTIDILNTSSKYADINLYGVTLESYIRDREVSISTGRVAPTVEGMLRNKLRGEDIKSDFIQVSGDNYRISSVNMKLPFKNSNGEGLRVLRYDESTRRFSEINFKVNKIDKTVEFTSMEKGIFVVVE